MYKKPDYEFKAEMLKDGWYHLFVDIQKWTWFKSKAINFGEALEYQEPEPIRYKFAKKFPLEYKECNRLYDSNHKRKIRLNSRVKKILDNGQCYFLTFTFDNNSMNNTSYETKRKYLTRWLKANTMLYVANEDYGSKNHRLHFHAIVRSDYIDATTWQCGALNYEIIHTPNEKKLASYIAKLANHTIKATNKRSVLIYSR